MPSCWRSSHAFVLASFWNEAKTNTIMPMCWGEAVATHAFALGQNKYAMPLCWRKSHAFVLATFQSEVKTNMIVAMPMCLDKAVATPLCWNGIVATPLCWDKITINESIL